MKGYQVSSLDFVVCEGVPKMQIVLNRIEEQIKIGLVLSENLDTRLGELLQAVSARFDVGIDLKKIAIRTGGVVRIGEPFQVELHYTSYDVNFPEIGNVLDLSFSGKGSHRDFDSACINALCDLIARIELKQKS